MDAATHSIIIKLVLIVILDVDWSVGGLLFMGCCCYYLLPFILFVWNLL